ncbi:MAG: hypothetical protein JO253_04650 [Alphaproteobacteria bacterium]|nr:hypothetical protein [Alphaproteobacteria bacterium]
MTTNTEIKKPSTLAEQIKQAREEWNSWPQSVREGVKLQGNSIYRDRFANQSATSA